MQKRLRETDKAVLIPNVKGTLLGDWKTKFKSPQVGVRLQLNPLQTLSTTLGATKEAETLLLWLEFALVPCSRQGSGNHELRDTTAFSPGHGMHGFLLIHLSSPDPLSRRLHAHLV